MLGSASLSNAEAATEEAQLVDTQEGRCQIFSLFWGDPEGAKIKKIRDFDRD